MRIASEEFIASHTGKGDFITRAGYLLGDDIGVDRVDGGKVHLHHCFLDGLDDFLGRELDFAMVGFVLGRDEPGEFAFIIASVLEADGEGVQVFG